MAAADSIWREKRAGDSAPKPDGNTKSCRMSALRRLDQLRCEGRERPFDSVFLATNLAAWNSRFANFVRSYGATVRRARTSKLKSEI
ncbi:MAG: hypothetical protein JWM11_654 [Planctomycetaceae bacterium]|nr:hypothetical protein [Planctomycetaceae bacterium]